MTSEGGVNIPTEILQLIFTRFCIHCRGESDFPGPEQDPNQLSWYSLERHTLFSLCLASRRFCEIAQPILYHEFVLGYGHSSRSKLYSWDGRLTSFLRTVKKRRDLATLVKWILIHPDLLEPIYNEGTRDIPQRPRRVYELAKTRALHRVGDLIAILLAQLSKLQRCSLLFGGTPVETVRTSALQAAGVSSLPVTTVDVSGSATRRTAADYLFSLDYRARPFIELSIRLETLNLHMCGSTWSPSPVPFLPNLRTLRITHSRLTDADLKRLLSSCTGLQNFVYEATCPSSPSWRQCTMEFGLDHFNAANAATDLDRFHATMKSLHLDLRSRLLIPFDPNTDSQPAFSFRDFTVLEHLFLNLSELYDMSSKESPEDSQVLVKLLPPDIKSLHLAGYIGSSLGRLAIGLLSLADAASEGRFPRLEEVRCDAEQKFDDAYGVDAIFAAVGVDFGYESWPHSEPTLRETDMSPPSYEPLPLPSDDDSDL